MGLSNNLGKLSNMITSTGSAVGIAQASPAYTLDVTGTGRFSGSVGIGTTASLTSKFTVFSPDASTSWDSTSPLATISNLDQTNGQGFALLVRGGALDANCNIFEVQDYSASSKLVVKGTGNVGIGTSSPNSILDIGTSAPRIRFWNGGVATGNLRLGGMFASNAYGSSTVASSSSIDFYTDGSAWYKGYISFSTNGSDSTNSEATERMRITSDGNVEMQGTNSNAKFRFWRNYSGNNPGLSVYNTSGTEVFAYNGNNGSLAISGALSKGSGSFRIEHPLESLSQTHQLVHSFIEGPQADLIYRGKLTLVNGKAEANIDLVSTMTEGTFEALCREVQCFTTNESGWDLIKGKVIGNIIYIESQNENSTDEISWMVIGERKDKHMMDTDWTDENGKIIVEPLKPIEPIVPSEPINQD